MKTNPLPSDEKVFVYNLRRHFPAGEPAAWRAGALYQRVGVRLTGGNKNICLKYLFVENISGAGDDGCAPVRGGGGGGGAGGAAGPGDHGAARHQAHHQHHRGGGLPLQGGGVQGGEHQARQAGGHQPAAPGPGPYNYILYLLLNSTIIFALCKCITSLWLCSQESLGHLTERILT